MTLSNGVIVDQIDQCNLFLGYNSRNALFHKIGFDFDHECLKLNEGYETNLDNIYAFGAVMAQWDGSAPKQTYIHNGNIPQLVEIMNHIVKKEMDGIMDSKRVHPSSMLSAPMVKRSLYNRVVRRVKRTLLVNDIDKVTYDKVMIVVHPDDESLWGGDALEQEKGWFVICLTNADNKVRAKKFNKVMDVFQVDRNIYNFPDLGTDAFSDGVLKDLEAKLTHIVNHPSVKKVVTHGPDGEYGHAAHKTISFTVKSVLSDQDKLHYFSFSKPGKDKLSAKKQKAFDIYFGPVGGSLLSTKLIRSVSFVTKYVVKFVLNTLKLKNFDVSLFWKRVRYAYQGNGGAVQTDLEHCNLSRFENIVHHSKYINYDELLNENYFERRLSKNVRGVYLGNRSLYDSYPDRKYMITEYLPTCVGKTLGVGCHVHNKDDALCLPTPSDYETIDISEKCEMYGSPFKHTTVDFIAYLPGYKFNHITLFGVMGIPFKSDGDDDTYSLYGGDEKVVSHVDELLNVNGTVLFSPNFSIDKSKSTKDKIKYWDDFVKNNEMLSKNYQLVHKFSTSLNYVIVCKKIA